MDWVGSRTVGLNFDLARPGVKTGPYVRSGVFGVDRFGDDVLWGIYRVEMRRYSVVVGA